MENLFVQHDRVLILKGIKDKEQLINELVFHCIKIGILDDSKKAVEGILKREALGSTGIGDGVAIPHAKLQSVNGVNVVFAFLPDGVDFDSLDSKPVRYVFLIFSNEKETALHLKTLASIAKLIKNTDFTSKIDEQSTVRQIEEILIKLWSSIV
ncbi:MAG: PTS sugar transporter subunit IIA [Calditerrivibrio sp.]|nr:PTS sugar transporter subunit IIA [Calditerrivibrio sp.]